MERGGNAGHLRNVQVEVIYLRAYFLGGHIAKVAMLLSLFKLLFIHLAPLCTLHSFVFSSFHNSR